MADRCDCHDLLVEDCDRLHSAERREAAEARAEHERRMSLIDRGLAIPARYPGTCAVCGEGFAVGTPITLDKRTFSPASTQQYDSKPPMPWVAACCLNEHGRVGA